jgi:hypothetical protein
MLRAPADDLLLQARASGMGSPSGFTISPGCVPPPPSPQIGYDLGGRNLHDDGWYGRAQSPAPSVFEVPASGDGDASEASENDGGSKGGDLVVPDKMCTLNTMGTSPDTHTPKAEAKRSANDDMETVVARCVKIYKEEGLDALVNEILQEGTRDYQGSLWNATATRLVFEQLEKQGDPHVEQVSQALRSEVLGRFKEYWSDVSVFFFPLETSPHAY